LFILRPSFFILRPLSHDFHFLSRVQRVSPREADLAMQLYRDPKLVALLLADAGVAEDAPRAAIALRDGDGAPHVVVSRDGHFVTCLGAGMSPGSLPVVSHPALTSALARVGLWRERVAAAESVRGEDPFDIDFFFALHKDAHALSREDVGGAVALAPLVGPEYLRSLALDLMEFGRARVQAREERRRKDTFPGAPERFWRISWSLGHFMVLSFAEPEVVSEFAAGHWDDVARVPLFALTGHFLPYTMRAFWAAGRCGRMILPACKKMLAGPDGPGKVDVPLAMAVIAMGHSRLEAEIRKVLARTPGPAATMALEVMDNAPRGLAAHLETGRDLAVKVTSKLPAGSRWRFERPEDVPEDLAGSFAANSWEDPVSREGLVDVLSALPWLARAAPEDLYLPAGLLRELRRPWTEAMTDMLLDRFDDKPRPQAVRAGEPGRNDPCPCGSGRKFKKCCGAAG